jgi:hypothetical protein
MVSLHCDPRAASSCYSKLQRLEEWIAANSHGFSGIFVPSASAMKRRQRGWKLPELNGGFFMGTSSK